MGFLLVACIQVGNKGKKKGRKEPRLFFCFVFWLVGKGKGKGIMTISIGRAWRFWVYIKNSKRERADM